MLQPLLHLLTTDVVIHGIAWVVGTLFLLVIGKLGWNRLRIYQVAKLAYEAINALKDKIPTEVDDKVAAGLSVVVEILGRDLAPAEAVAVAEHFDALHAAETDRKAAAEALLTRAIKAGALPPLK